MPKHALGGGGAPVLPRAIQPAAEISSPQILSQVGSVIPSIPDSTGITVVGRVADGLRLISQFGVPNTMIVVLIIMFSYGAVSFRATLLTVIDKNEERSERRYQEQRQDHRDERTIEWQKLGALTESITKASDASSRANDRLVGAIETNGYVLQSAAKEISKSSGETTKVMERQSATLERLEKAIDGKKGP